MPTIVNLKEPEIFRILGTKGLQLLYIWLIGEKEEQNGCGLGLSGDKIANAIYLRSRIGGLHEPVRGSPLCLYCDWPFA